MDRIPLSDEAPDSTDDSDEAQFDVPEETELAFDKYLETKEDLADDPRSFEQMDLELEPVKE